MSLYPFGRNPLPPLRSDLGCRFILNAEFKNKKAVDPSFSLRKFAKVLGLSHQHLLMLLRGKKGLSPQSAARIASYLGLSGVEHSLFLTVVDAESARCISKRRTALRTLNRAHEVMERRIQKLKARFGISSSSE